VEDLQHLSELVADLQELSIAEAGKLHYEMADIDLAQIVDREAVRARATVASGVDVSVRGDEQPAIVHGDERRLAQVLRNLLSNAVRHTSSGSIDVAVERDNESVIVRVTDTGEGIPPEDLLHIFERFFRADAARAADTGGAGLGLAISSSIVRDHGGDVFATSELDQGTTVGFRLPVARA